MKLIVGNWKMNPGSLGEAEKVLRAVKIAAGKATKTKVVACPPHVYLGALRKTAGLSRLALGAQDCFYEDKGARTGETSPAMLASLGVKYVIVGHSERRALGETNEDVSRKIAAAGKHGLNIVLCVGELDRDGEEGVHYARVRDQLRASLEGVPAKHAPQLVIAYEPVWAIGAKAKRAASPEDHREMAILIKKHLVERFGQRPGFAIPILYGGSVDDRNAGGFLREGAADGLLIGRVSLVPEQFNNIVVLANTIK